MGEPTWRQTVERREDLGREWREHRELDGSQRASEQLLRVARLRRDPERWRGRLGPEVFDAELGNSLDGVCELLGKLSATLDVLRRPRGHRPIRDVAVW